jgi:hypothetical protein
LQERHNTKAFCHKNLAIFIIISLDQFFKVKVDFLVPKNCYLKAMFLFNKSNAYVAQFTLKNDKILYVNLLCFCVNK